MAFIVFCHRFAQIGTDTDIIVSLGEWEKNPRLSRKAGFTLRFESRRP